MDVAPCQQDLHAYSSSWLLEVEFCWASWLGCYSGLLGRCRKIYFATKVVINFSFLQAGWAHTCASSVQNILFSQAGPFQGLCALSVLTGTTRVFKGMSLDGRNTDRSVWCLMPFWALSWPLLSIADTPQPVPRATVVSYRGLSGLGEINFSVWGIVLHCLIPPWSSVKLQPAGLSWNMLLT